MLLGNYKLEHEQLQLVVNYKQELEHVIVLLPQIIQHIYPKVLTPELLYLVLIAKVAILSQDHHKLINTTQETAQVLIIFIVDDVVLVHKHLNFVAVLMVALVPLPLVVFQVDLLPRPVVLLILHVLVEIVTL